MARAYIEPMASVPLIKPQTLFGRDDWARMIAPIPGMGVMLVIHCWALIVAAAALFIVWPNLFTYVLAVMVIGARQLGLAILMHEGAHGLLARNKRLNDILGGALTGTIVGADIKAYRDYHLKHHKYAQQAEDPDLVLSEKFPVTRASLRRKIIRDLTGQTFFKQRIAPLFARDSGPIFSGVNGKFLAANAILFALCALAGYWWAYVALWLVPLATWNPLVTRLRNIGEHACVGNEPDPWKVARTTRANAIERLLLAPYWVHYHSEHHLFMYAPCYRLARIHEALKARGVTEKMHVADGYWPVLRAASAA